MNSRKIESIQKELVVEASQEKAFKVFTEKMDLWWPRSHHIGRAPMTCIILEPGVNGRWYSKHEDGSEANVGKVLVWQPNDLLVLGWQINANFQFDPELITEVEVNFIPDGPKRTKIKFKHLNLARMGEGGKAIDSMDEGWGQILELYKAVTTK